jgi:hypothetical protein
LLYVLVFYTWTLWRSRKIKTRSSYLILSFLLFVALLIPWIWRNLCDLGQFIPTTTTLGYNLWRGNNHDATGAGRSLAGVDEPTPADIEAEINTLLPQRGFELQMDKIFMRRALNFIFSRPLSVLFLALRKQFYFWVSDLTHPLARTPYYLFPTVVLAFLAFWGILWPRPQGEAWVVLYLAIFLPALTASVFFVLPRYRMFIDPLLMLPATKGGAQLWAGLSRLAQRWRTS